MCSAEKYVVQVKFFSTKASRLKTANFFLPQTVIGKNMRRQPNGKQRTRELPNNNFDSS
jgi:hypothetical protein